MDAPNIDPVALMVDIIKDHSPENIWRESPLHAYRDLGNTNRGEIGEEFVRRYLTVAGITVSPKGNRAAITDLQIAGRQFEVKTASLGAKNTFQFNHVRLDRHYEYLLVLGVCPLEIVFNLWRKGDVAEGKAGTLVRMAEGQAVTWKLTKRLSTMLPIEKLPEMLRELIIAP